MDGWMDVQRRKNQQGEKMRNSVCVCEKEREREWMKQAGKHKEKYNTTHCNRIE
jgi:hypothetical protein